MKLSYFDLLSGRPIQVSGIGHVKSPKLKDIAPDGEINQDTYDIFLGVLSWDKDKIILYDEKMQYHGVDKLKNEGLSVFDVMTLLPQTRELCGFALSFFIEESVAWDQSKRAYVIFYKNADGTVKEVGLINKRNFDYVRKLLLQLNYIGLDEDEAPVRHSSDASKDAWDRVQDYLANQAKTSSKEDKKEYHLGNIISKLCAAHPSYNLFNVYELTIFQLYDSFFQLGYIRSSNLSERIFSNHGGEKFKFEEWLKPIIKEQ